MQYVPSLIVVHKSKLVPDDDSPYLIVELRCGSSEMNEDEPGRYLWGEVIGRLPYSEAATALLDAIGPIPDDV